MASPKKRAHVEATAAFLAEPEALSSICDHLGDGARTLYEFCAMNSLRYRQVHDWLHDKAYPERISTYALALEARDSQLTDRVQRVIREVTELDVRDLFDKRGELKQANELPDHVARAIASVEVSVDKEGRETRKMRLSDRLKGADMLGRGLGMFKDRLEVTGKGGGPLQTEEVSTNEAARRVAFLLSAAVRGKTKATATAKE